MLLISCLDWGVSPNFGGALYALCPQSSGTNDNGNLQGVTYYNGGPGYTQYVGFGQMFTYGSLNRLASAGDSGGWSRNLCYDAWGNMWVTANSGLPLASNTPQEIGGVCPSSGTSPYNAHNQMSAGTYDASGNLLSVNGNTAAYDAENRMTSVTDTATYGTENYLYDGDGKRVEKAVSGGASTVYVYDTFGRLAAEYSSATTAQAPCTTCYLAWDHLGSTRMVTDQNGNVVARHDYLPFGEEIPAGVAGRGANQYFGVSDSIEPKFTLFEIPTRGWITLAPDTTAARWGGSLVRMSLTTVD